MSHAFYLLLVASTTSLGLLALACDRDPVQKSAPITTAGPIAPSTPVNADFAGCAKSCGSRMAKDRSAARAQPGVEPGEIAYCPVSGAVFMVKQDSPSREITVNTETKRLWFCCESCAKWFDAHQDEVLRARGLAPAS